MFTGDRININRVRVTRRYEYFQPSGGSIVYHASSFNLFIAVHLRSVITKVYCGVVRTAMLSHDIRILPHRGCH